MSHYNTCRREIPFQKKLKWNVLGFKMECSGVLPSREVADAFDATDAPPIFTEDLKEALVCLRDGKLWANGDHLGGQF